MTDQTTDADVLKTAREAASAGDIAREAFETVLLSESEPLKAQKARQGELDHAREIEVAALAVTMERARKDALDRAAQTAARETAAPVDGGEVLRIARERGLVEGLAKHLHDEHDENTGGGGENWTWPEHENDEGYRGDGSYVRIAPTDVQMRRREAAKRILRFVEQEFDRLAAHPAQATIPETPVLGDVGADRAIPESIEVTEIDWHAVSVERFQHPVLIGRHEGEWFVASSKSPLFCLSADSEDGAYEKARQALLSYHTISVEHLKRAAPAPDQTPPRGGVTVTRAAIWEAVSNAIAASDLRPGWNEMIVDNVCAVIAALSRQSAGAGTERVRHVQGGFEYDVLHRRVTLRTRLPLLYGADLIVLRDAEGGLHARTADEFGDGRFVPAPPETPPAGSPQDETGGPA